MCRPAPPWISLLVALVRIRTHPAHGDVLGIRKLSRRTQRPHLFARKGKIAELLEVDFPERATFRHTVCRLQRHGPSVQTRSNHDRRQNQHYRPNTACTLWEHFSWISLIAAQNYRTQ